MLSVGMGSLALLVAALVVWMIDRASGRAGAIRAASVIAVLMAVQLSLADSGVFRLWDRRPPPLLIPVVVSLALVAVVAWSDIGSRIAANTSYAALVGMQAFRLPLELVMHQAAVDGVMPIQMSYSGWNFDIVTGLLAIPVAWRASRPACPRWLIAGWNALGALFLLNIVSIAVASLPIFSAFGPDRVNTWVGDAPFIWLPGVLVPAALFGHLLIWRKLRMSRVAVLNAR